MTWLLAHQLAFPYHYTETSPIHKEKLGCICFFIVSYSYHCVERSQRKAGGKVNYDLWLPVLHCVTSVGSWSPNLGTGSALTWSAQWQESSTQTDLIWQRETRADLALQSYGAWPRGHHGNSWEASSGMKHQQRFIHFRPPETRFGITSVSHGHSEGSSPVPVL